jgi:hypothetical protein
MAYSDSSSGVKNWEEGVLVLIVGLRRFLCQAS